MSDQVFVLDANVFIEAHRRYYAFDIAPKFWEILLQHAGAGRVKSIDRIKDEISRGKDALTDWAEKKFGTAFVSTDDEDVIRIFGQAMQWVDMQDQFSEAAKEEFAGVADGWLVAYAAVSENTVGTHEIFNPGIKRKVPIPNLCRALGVSFVNPFDMMRSLAMKWM